MKRIFDILFASIGIVLLSPFFLIISVLIVVDSRGGVFYKQVRVGKDGKDFLLFKFRSMTTGSDQKGLLTIGGNDARITKMGTFIRKYKLDEFPQLINVVLGDMSLVGPRPEVRKYVDLYNANQRRVLEVKPGITDYASIEYSNENELLGASKDPETTYINEVMPAKLNLNLKYINEMGIGTDLKIIFTTIKKILS